MPQTRLDPDPCSVLWGKSNAGGQPNLLLQHALDTAAVGELLWDHYLAPVVKQKVDACAGERGRAFFALLCGLHDVGKASPAFQSKDDALAGRVRAAGLTWLPLDPRGRTWHHTLAGAVIVRGALSDAGWDADAIAWFWPLVGGHHGRVPGPGRLRLRKPSAKEAHGRGVWPAVQADFMNRVAFELGVDPGQTAPICRLRRADQLALLGALIMADWLASDERHFPGVNALSDVSAAGARSRAAAAWQRMGMRGGWSRSSLGERQPPFERRFGQQPRPSQTDGTALVQRMPGPGLVIVEAPMGEGKTETALAMAEIMARRFGADGVFVGMPTQATSDPMFTRVRSWSSSIEQGVPVALLHGKRRFNPEWRAMQEHVDFQGVDEYGVADPYGDPHPSSAGGSDTPAEWFLGRKRGLLTPVTVGTIDQLLHAATRTRHVMLRHAGLTGRVVVLDEVHAYDVYMSQFLFEALRWLGDSQVPVVLLSATLPPDSRRQLVRAYLQGALQSVDVDLHALPVVSGYPTAMSACVVDGEPRFDEQSSPSWRPGVEVEIEVLPEQPDGDPSIVADVVYDAVAEGGCALVVCNTVARAQQTFRAVADAFGSDALLLHARLTAGERAKRTEHVLRLLGAPGRPGMATRPHRLVVVATQVAEQSFDVDADLLVTDLAPIDLLLQRIGRLHRHERPEDARPPRVRTPRAIVTGVSKLSEAQAPQFPKGSSFVYGRHSLLRCAALLLSTTRLSVPGQVPALVSAGYGVDTLHPEAWQNAMSEAEREARHAADRRRSNAETFLLAGEQLLGAPTLAGLHDRDTAELADDDAVAAVVRDGEPSVEVVLVRRRHGQYLTLDGRSLGINGEAVSDDTVLESVLSATVRLPGRPALTAAAVDELRPLPAWGDRDPWLRHARALVLDDAMTAVLGGRLLTYDLQLGLLDAPATSSLPSTFARAGTT